MHRGLPFMLSNYLLASKYSTLNNKFLSRRGFHILCNKKTYICSLVNLINTSTTMVSAQAYEFLHKIGCFSDEHIHVRDKDKTEQLIKDIVHGGFSKLQVIMDYDRTVTKLSYNNKPVFTSHGILDNSKLMPEFYRRETAMLAEKYYPIEIDPNLSEEEKIPIMIEWYDSVHSLMARCNIRKDRLEEMVCDSNIKLRDKVEDVFRILYEKEVPTLILSAGIGDLIQAVLNHFKLLTDNVKIVSNFFEYNESGVMMDFAGDLIHMFNKNENAIHSSEYFDVINSRRNVILLGDSMGDVKMAVGVPRPNNILKIGFLNEKVQERLTGYKDAYDIVLTNDHCMSPVEAILKLIED